MQQLLERGVADSVVTRDTTDGTDIVDEAWIGANFTPEEERSDAQRERLRVSETLVEELFAADILVIAVPIYNFGIPASLKAWIDQVARARRTFRYSEEGPEGLLGGRKAYLLVTSGGTAADSEIDFATPYLRHVLRFMGIDDVTVIAADRLMTRGDEALQSALDEISATATAPARVA